MNRIKLSGKEKHKKILLLVLVIIAIGIMFYEYKMKTNGMQREAQQEMGKEEYDNKSIGNTKDNSLITEDVQINKESKEIIAEDNKTSEVKKEANSQNTKINEISKMKKSYSNRENDLYNQAYTLFFSHDYDSAINKANCLTREFPNNPMGYNIKGIAKAYNGDYKDGMNDIDKSLQIDQNYGYARFNKALAYELYGNMEQALKWYNKALEVEEYVWSYYGISSIYGRSGDIDNTMKYLNKAIQMDQGIKEVAKEEHDFDSVRDFAAFKKAVYN